MKKYKNCSINGCFNKYRANGWCHKHYMYFTYGSGKNENLIKARKKYKLTHCRNGHKRTPENTYILPDKSRSHCRECHKNINNKYWADYYIKNRKKYLERNKNYSLKENSRNILRKISERSYQNNKQKWICRAKTRYAIKKGLLNKSSCQNCGNTKVQAHHDDYNDHLKIKWFCDPCHRAYEGRSVFTLAELRMKTTP